MRRSTKTEPRTDPSKIPELLEDLDREISDLAHRVVVKTGTPLLTIGGARDAFRNLVEDFETEQRKHPDRKVLPKRESNLWMLFHHQDCKTREGPQGEDTSAKRWGNASDSEKEYYKLLAKFVKHLHEQRFPEYTYTPDQEKKKVKKAKKMLGKTEDIVLSSPQVDRNESVPEGSAYSVRSRTPFMCACTDLLLSGTELVARPARERLLKNKCR